MAKLPDPTVKSRWIYGGHSGGKKNGDRQAASRPGRKQLRSRLGVWRKQAARPGSRPVGKENRRADAYRQLAKDGRPEKVGRPQAGGKQPVGASVVKKTAGQANFLEAQMALKTALQQLLNKKEEHLRPSEMT